MDDSACEWSWEGNLHTLAGSCMTLRRTIVASHPLGETPLALRKRLPVTAAVLGSKRIFVAYPFKKEKDLFNEKQSEEGVEGVYLTRTHKSFDETDGSWRHSPVDLRGTTG